MKSRTANANSAATNATTIAVNILPTFLFAALTIGALAKVSFAGELIKLSISNSAQAAIFDKISKPFKAETGIELQYGKELRNLEANTSRNTIYFKELLDGKTEAAVAALPYEDWLQLMKEAKIDVPTSAQITYRVISRELFHVHTHSGVGVAKLTTAQLGAVFSGKVTNWKELGGADQSVTIILASDKPALQSQFQRFAMERIPFGKNTVLTKSVQEAYEKLRATPGSVTFLMGNIPRPDVSEIQIPELGRPTTLITKGRPSPNLDKLIDFVRKNHL
jgi:phosphate transport system substrate-binding protein